VARAAGEAQHNRTRVDMPGHRLQGRDWLGSDYSRHRPLAAVRYSNL